MKIKTYPQYVLKNTSEDHTDPLLIEEEKDKKHYALSKILTRSCTIILYTVEENIFVVIAYKLLAQKKYLQLMVYKVLRYLKNVNMLDWKFTKKNKIAI